MAKKTTKKKAPAVEQPNPLEPQRFEFDGLTLVYDFDKISVEQSSVAKNILIFQHNQGVALPDTFSQVHRSGGSVWMPYCFSHLALVEKDGDLLTYNFSKAETLVYDKLKTLPAKELDERMEDVVLDFFTRNKLGATALDILRPRKEQAARTMLSHFLLMVTNAKYRNVTGLIENAMLQGHTPPENLEDLPDLEQ